MIIRAGYHFLSSLDVARCIMTLLIFAVDFSAALHQKSLVVPCPLYPVSYTKFQFSHGIPDGCVQSECDYFVGINPSSDENLLEFTLEGNARGWVAVGFSKTPSMYSADVVGCGRHSSGLVAVIDTWNLNYFKYNVVKEQQNDICHYHAEYDSGRLKCTFSRTINGSDLKHDLDLNNHYYLLFGLGQTPRDSFAQGFTYHSRSTPIISETMMNPVTGTIAEVTTVASPSQHDHSNTTAAQTYTTMATTVTAAAVDEAGQEDSSTEPQNSSVCPTSPLNQTHLADYRLTHRTPSGCDPSQCDYFLGISTNPYNNNLLDFTLEGRVKGWIAVGFSKTSSMLEADVVGCNVYSDGRVVAVDTWNPLSPRWNVLDDDQSDICHYDAEIKDHDRLRCRFSRSIRGSSSEQDLNLNNNYYLLFGKGQNPQMLENGGFTYHNRAPFISRVMINPVHDSDLSIELSLIANNLNLCPSTMSNSSTYRISQGFPKGCEQSECEYFVGINTNPEDDRFLDFTLEGNAEGWVAIGFSDSPTMANSDVLGCIRHWNGMSWVVDTWNPASKRANILDETQIDICLHSIEYSDGRLQCTFSRSVLGDTPDTDVNLDGDYYFLFGVGNKLQNNTISGGLTYHDLTPHVSIELINPVNDSNNKITVSQEFSRPIVQALLKTHGILMIIAWPILTGAAIYFSAFMKPVLSKKGEWFYVHEGILLVSVVLTAASLAIIFTAHVGRRVSGLVDLSDTLSLTHFVIGIIVASGQIFNMIVALFRCKPSSRFRWIYNIIHGKIIGYITALLSLANVAVGIYLFDSSPSPAFGLFMVVAIIGVLMYEVLHLFYNVLPQLLKLRRKKGEEEQSLLSIHEKYADTNDDGKSPLTELKLVLAYSYRHHFGTLALVLTVIVPINIAVCVFIAIA